MVEYIYSNIQKFCEQMNDAFNALKHLYSRSDTNNDSVDRLFDSLNDTLSNLMLHTQLDKGTAKSVDFGKSLANFFKNKQKKKISKHVKFIYKDGFDGEARPIDIQNDPIAAEFTVDNCMPVMELVPLQIYSNAYKYMPDHSTLIVELTVTENRKYFSFRNLGPQTEQSEKENVFESGVRGINTSSVSGRGLGLSQVKQVLRIHKDWLNPLMSVDTDEEIVHLNGIPYSWFILNLSFLRHSVITGSMNDTVNPLSDNLLPKILFHNCYEIIEAIYNIVVKLETLNEKSVRESWINILHEMRIYLSEFNHQIVIGDFVGSNDPDTLNGSGFIMVSPSKAFTASAKSLQSIFYPDVKVSSQGRMRKSVSAGNTFYLLIQNLLDLIFRSLPENKESEIILEYFENMVTVHFSHDISLFSEPIIDGIVEGDAGISIDINNIEHFLPSIYALMFANWGYSFNFNKRKIWVMF